MDNYRVRGIIIKRRNYKEADKLLTIFTREYGKITVIGKGVRRITSRRAFALELFNHVEFFLHPSKNFVDIIIEAQVVDTFSKIKAELNTIGKAYEMCELVDIMTREDQENEGVYEVLLTSLHKMNTKEPVLVDKFKRHLLVVLGFLGEDEDTQEELTTYIENIAERTLRAPRIYE
ncbi:MAG TPA: DNA repair protein RecO [Patescibacteria group bacterium]|nr:DNA repair protein RecO [Patescibacteria group bacterium]